MALKSGFGDWSLSGDSTQAGSPLTTAPARGTGLETGRSRKPSTTSDGRPAYPVRQRVVPSDESSITTPAAAPSASAPSCKITSATLSTVSDFDNAEVTDWRRVKRSAARSAVARSALSDASERDCFLALRDQLVTSWPVITINATL